MRMPNDFVEAINAAVLAVDPDAGRMISGSFTLGADFDQWLGPKAMLKYGLGPMPAEEVAAFEAKFAERRQEIKDSLIASSVDRAKQRLAEKRASIQSNEGIR